MSRGSFQIHIMRDTLWAQWGIGNIYRIGSVTPRGNRKLPSKQQMKEAKSKLLELYESFHKMSYEVAVEKMRQALDNI